MTKHTKKPWSANSVNETRLNVVSGTKSAAVKMNVRLGTRGIGETN